jgi:plastocyanin
MTKVLTRRGVLVGAAASAVALVTRSEFAVATAVTIHDVAIKGFAFEPQEITVRPGDLIRWTNTDLVVHTATAKALGWDTGEIASGETAEVRVTAEIERSYFCAFHPHMTGTIRIRSEPQ